MNIFAYLNLSNSLTNSQVLSDSCEVIETVELLNCVPPRHSTLPLSANLGSVVDNRKPDLLKRSFTTPGVTSKQRPGRSRAGRITDTGLFCLCGRGLKRISTAALPHVDGSGFRSLSSNSDFERRTSNTKLKRLASMNSLAAEAFRENIALTQFTVTGCPRVSKEYFDSEIYLLKFMVQKLSSD